MIPETYWRNVHTLLTALFILIVVAANLIAEPMHEQIEDDWRRQDQCRMTQIREQGLVRFTETQIQWPGVKPDNRLHIPKCPAPILDGHLDDACWKQAVQIPTKAADQPSFLLCQDNKRFYIGVSLPTKSEALFTGHFTARDAAGAVDGIKNGKFGFHTWHEPNPWWQVDLGASQPISKIIVYNRLDYIPGLHNADNLIILTSDDEKNWTLRYDNKGKYFGGAMSGKQMMQYDSKGKYLRKLPNVKPLEVKFKPGEVRARFVRLQVRHKTPIFFHLDEVEIYGATDPMKNIALNRPAKQSSLSIWSRGGQRGCALFTIGKTRVAFKAPNSGMIINDIPASKEQAQVLREGGQTSVEISLPLRGKDGKFPATFLPPQGNPVHLAVNGDWQITWKEISKLGFGKNRILLELHASAPVKLPVEVMVESVIFTATRPQKQIVFQEKIDKPISIPIEFEIAHEGPAAIIVSARQGEIRFRDGRTFFIEPVQETLHRAERLLVDFKIPPPKKLAELRARADALAAREKSNGADPVARSAIYREARWLTREVAFKNPLLNFNKLLFVKRFTQETYPDVCLNHMPWVSRPGGDICILSPVQPNGEVRNLLNGALGPGHVHGIDLWWDANKVIFGYAKAKSNKPPAGWLDRRASYRLRRTEEPTHIFEIGIDKNEPRQLTSGEWSDLDPTYLPNGDIAFVSERCSYSLQCNEYDKDETSCNLYVMRPDGSDIRRLSVTKDGDYLPHTLDDGTIGYTRWEYQERGWAHIQSIWTVRPDGTEADALFKQHLNNPWALEDVRSIPNSRKLVAIATGHHTLPAGPVVVIDPRKGMNDSRGIHIVTPGVSPPEGGMSGTPVSEGGVLGSGGFYMTPWPLSEKYFLVSYTFGKQTDPTGYAIYLIDVYGTKELVYSDPNISCFVPIPLRPRPRPPILSDKTEPSKLYATCAVSNVGRGVDGIPQSAIRYIRISERIAWPYDNKYGGHRYEPDVKSVMINWTPARVIGTVPVEKDGSAYFRVPVDTPVYFQLLDKNQMELRRMRSFISFQPGEVRECVGCHETRGVAPASNPTPLALRREPSIPTPPPWGSRIISFLRDVQPVFDRYCVRCHSGLKPAGGLDFSGGLTARHNRAYDTILAHGLVSRSNVGDDAKVTPPLAFGSHKSKLIQALREGLHKNEVRMRKNDWLRLVTWIDANAPYHGGFINKRPDKKPYNLAADSELIRKITVVHARRCASCHNATDLSRTDWIDIYQPRRSLFLTAPLPKNAGGTGKCEDIYKDQNDPDYQTVLQAVESSVEKVWERPRRDVRTLEQMDLVVKPRTIDILYSNQ